MDNQYNWARLDEPFDEADVHWRVGRIFDGKSGPSATLLAYLDARNVMDRLDEVFGKQGWSDTYTQGPDGGVMCTISVRCGDGWVSKSDGASNTQVEAIKGGYSGALKRAAVKWGVGRYLYRLGNEKVRGLRGYGDGNVPRHKGRDGSWVHFPVPRLPSWARPKVIHESWPNDRAAFCIAVKDHFDTSDASSVFKFIVDELGMAHPKYVSDAERADLWATYLRKDGTVKAFKAWEASANGED